MEAYIKILAQDGGGLGELAFIIAVLVFSGIGYLAEWLKNKNREKEAEGKWGPEKKPTSPQKGSRPVVKVELPRRPGQQKPTAGQSRPTSPAQRQARPISPPQPQRQADPQRYQRQPVAEREAPQREEGRRQPPPPPSREKSTSQPAAKRSLRDELQEAESLRQQAEKEVQARKAEAEKEAASAEQAKKKAEQIRQAEAKAQKYRRHESVLRERYAEKKGGKGKGGQSVLSGMTGGRSFQGLSRAELRRAVLLREIFGAPAALREELASWEM